ncbi:MAG: abortive infection protein [Cycloclasticus sp. symbiont of Bathymodiolus heckerae]|nr:MAG: abortive infection protein [Cycloclasticus sp. symbiont of Bathymodiolus heckerae]
MKASIFFLFYFLIASALAATIAFPLFQAFGNDAYKFESWVTRSALLFLILGLIPSIKYLKLSLDSIGHNVATKSASKQITIGFVIGLIILSVVIASLLVLDVRVISTDIHLTFKLILKALLAGIVVAFIEETLFRGLFFTLTKKWHNATVAVLVSSFFYASLHFIKPLEHIDQNLLTFSSGFEVIFNAFKAFPQLHLDDFFALFVVGVLLALVRLRTQSLTYCIGLHASWVFLIKICKELTDSNKTSDWAFLTGHYDGIIGVMSFAWLALLAIAYAYFIIAVPRQPNH